jgi:hypothetical protein
MGTLIQYELTIERVDTLSVFVRVPEGTTPEEMMAHEASTIALAENLSKAVVNRQRHLVSVERSPAVVEGGA